ncbi:unnamed protein product [Peronospora effusa]|nr:unnamed protein product [Peronospora effusa]
MSNKVELNKYGRPVGWHGQSWAYYKGMMKLTFEEKDVLDYATGNKILVGNASANEVKAFREAQVTFKQVILASLSMELGQRVMTKATGTEMWKYLEDFYERKTNAATRTNQEIILYNKLNAMKCKPNWDVAQHVENMFMIKDQLVAVNAGIRDPIFTQMLIRSLPANARFDRLRGMVESGDDKVDTSEKLKDQILRMGSFNKWDRELGAHGVIGNVQDNEGSQTSKNRQNASCARSHIGARKLIAADKVLQSTTSQADKQHGNCFNCHKPGHRMRDCPIMKKPKTSDYQMAFAQHPKNELADGCQEKPDKLMVMAKNKLLTRENTPDRNCTQRQWCLDNASNVHVASDLRYFIDYSAFDNNAQAQCIRGFQKHFKTKLIVQGTVQILVQNGSSSNMITLYDVLYVPDCMNLISHTQVEDQGHTVKYCIREGERFYELWQHNRKLLNIKRDDCGLFTFNAINDFLSQTSDRGELLITDKCFRPQVNHTRIRAR